eukprot:1151367-Pelagomonas_calceolata.AAC.8
MLSLGWFKPPNRACMSAYALFLTKGCNEFVTVGGQPSTCVSVLVSACLPGLLVQCFMMLVLSFCCARACATLAGCCCDACAHAQLVQGPCNDWAEFLLNLC